MIRFEEVGVRYDESSRGAPLGSPRARSGAEPPEILNDVSLDLAAGSFHFVIGASGAGKSTLLRLMYLAVRPTSGKVSLFGRDVGQLGRAERALIRRRIGVVFQDFRLLPHLTAVENVALPLKVAGRREQEVRRHVEELLTWVGLADHLDAYPRTLSGGQQQRVAIARAVINRPSMLLADEPTGNVDDRIALRLLYLFEELNKLGTTVVIATHNERLVSRFRHPILRIRNSRVTADPFGTGGTFSTRDGGLIRASDDEAEVRRRAAARVSAAQGVALSETGKPGPAPAIAAPLKDVEEVAKEVKARATGKDVPGKDVQDKEAGGKDQDAKESAA